ncbi:RadC family protein [Coprothermobacter platensis]|uniref:RadC family protein n=1 Tax=Coprothermobacter platensis TaxID=108819 RepID=UPI000374C145|nr:DNA repair protein RadC [Coprothermobacter platensis]
MSDPIYKIPIKEWIVSERPRELLLTKGPQYLSDAKLLAIILRTGTREETAEDLALRLLNTFGGLTGLYKAGTEQLLEVKGVGMAKAAQIKAALEIGKRLLQDETAEEIKIGSPEDAVQYAAQYFLPMLMNENKEHFWVLLLDRKNHPIKHVELSVGTSIQTTVDPKEIVREISLTSAQAIIVIHNHPSGDPSPSKEDISATKLLKQACELVGAQLLDHVIIGKNRHLSLAREKLI